MQQQEETRQRIKYLVEHGGLYPEKESRLLRAILIVLAAAMATGTVFSVYHLFSAIM